ncbi:MAG TPA: HAMP domain-containing sensor histidine kinase [Polyangiales bacterium]|nr:HAMP domain-containing sensor histidine kinase [Polyangiales bacterium]
MSTPPSRSGERARAPAARSQRARPSIRTLLLGANAVVVLLPLLAVAGLRVYDIYLLRQTERQLLAESVVIGEAFREAWQRAGGGGGAASSAVANYRPPGHSQQPYLPIEPLIDLGVRVLPAQSPALRGCANGGQARARAAGASIEPLMQRAQTFNLSALRVLDPDGCVVATTRSETGLDMHALPEVQGALRGRYTAVARERISDEPPPPFGDIRRRGGVRVFSALPVFSDGQVIAVVRASRTGLDALTTLWANRRGLLLSGLALALLSIAVGLTFSAAIARPLRALTRGAQAIERGEPQQRLALPGFAPAEVAALGAVLEQMTERLRERAAYAAEFAAHAGHELKTPIAAIRGAAELLQQSWQEMEPAQRQRFLDNMQQDAERMERLVRGLLELARIENAPRELPAPLELRSTVAHVLARYGDAVVLSMDAAPQQLAIGEAQLDSVLTNLVDNALRHGGGQPVAVSLSERAGRLSVVVRDRGPGISPGNLPRVFQRFFTTERDRGGTGLGLATVKAIAEARGGHASVETTPTGSAFTVVL